ncbi:MAG: HD domain-containing protein [Deltaproteobacteria bacterium]|nr:HD domain-containing protein [Deltaproteobacteria bacterium]
MSEIKPDSSRPSRAPDEAVDVGRADRAIEALAYCVAISETGRSEGEIVASAQDLALIEVVTVRNQIERVLMGRNPEAGLDAMLSTGILDVLLPEVRAMVGFGDGEWRHKDVWKHTKQVVYQSVPRTEVRWAALLHDIGKIRTRRILPNGEVHFHGHAEVGASMFDRMQRRTKLFVGDDTLRLRVRELILHHLRASQYDGDWTDSAIRRFAREMGGCLQDLLDLSRADITTKRPERKRRGLESISELAQRVREIQAEDAKQPPLPKGLGTEISARFAIPPSPKLGQVMKELKERVEAGELDSQRECEYYLTFVGDVLLDKLA